jgi:predicted PurR-regulated permease PerM
VLLTVGLLIAVGVPLFLLVHFLERGVLGLAEAVASSKGWRGAFALLVTPGDLPAGSDHILAYVKSHLHLSPTAAMEIAFGGVGVFLFFFFLALGSFSLLTQGEELHAWIRARQPLKPEHYDRVGAAFTETGRGLFASIGLTCLTQGVLCTVTFFALGVPRGLVLGFICSIFAVLPVVGTPLIWGPIAAGFFLTGATAKGVILIVVGAGVIAAVEEVIGPLFAKVGRLQLSGPVILIGMFGGTLALGPGGLLLGPLVLRLAKELLDCAHEIRLASPAE